MLDILTKQRKKLISLIKIKLSKGKLPEQIAEELEEDIETIQQLMQKMKV